MKDYSQLSSEIQSKLKILKALVDNEKEVNELISKSETEKANEEFIKNEEKKKKKIKKKMRNQKIKIMKLQVDKMNYQI